MAIIASSFLYRISTQLQDPTNVKWPIDELVRYLNDAQRELSNVRPAAYQNYETMALTPGHMQSLSSEVATKLIKVMANATGTKGVVTIVSVDQLDATVRNWRSQSSNTVLHYMYDERTPLKFQVYPPAGAAASVELSYARLPDYIGSPANGGTWADASGTVNVSDLFANALQHYIFFKAYSKDAEYASNAALAQANYVMFQQIAGMEMAGTAAVSPKGAVSTASKMPS